VPVLEEAARVSVRRGRPPLVAYAGLCISVAGLLLTFSIQVLMHTPYEMSLYWPWLWPAGMMAGAAGFVVSTAGFIVSLRRGAGLALPVIGMVAGLLPTLLVAVPVALFFVLGLLFGA
jgi:hypothetical protein